MQGERYQNGDCDRYGDRVEPTNRTTAVHPFLFALLPLLAACQSQFPQITWRELLIPASLLLVPAFALVIALATFVPDRQRAALAVSWVLLCFFGQGLLMAVAARLAPGIAPAYLAVGLVAVGAIGLGILLKADWCDESATLFANVAGVAALCALGGPLAWQAYSAGAREKPSPLVASVGPAGMVPVPPRPALAALNLPAQPPDIYCLVFHRAASSAALEKHFRYKQPDFQQHLAQAGFVFPRMPEAGDDAPRAIAALLNGQPVANLPADPAALRPALRESQVVQRLVEAGYRYHHLGSPVPGLRDSPLAVENYAFFTVPSEFDEALLRHSVLWPWLMPQGFRARELGRAEHLLKLIAAPAQEPRFVLAQFMLPGDEWKFDADGSALTADELRDRLPAESYLRQTLFAQHLIGQFVPAILARRDRPAIILLAGDVPPELPPEALFHNKGVRPSCDLLSAVYLPDAAKRAQVPRTLAGADLFRFLFQAYFAGEPVRAEATAPQAP